MNNKLIGFEFTRVDGEQTKTFVPLDKILYVEELYIRDVITGKRTGETRNGARIHLIGSRETMLVEENYTDILDKWLHGTNNPPEHPGVFDLSN